ncbi:MAG: phosphatidylglycerophosphatase A [Candidatus Aminicenantes bacterium]|jgi:phosphatidylglycerophosphatase A
MRLFSKVLATFFGAGYFPLAQGTLTSFIIVLLYKFFLYRLHWAFYLLLVAGIFILGVFSSSVYSKIVKKKDPHQIVIDEVAGQLLVLFRLSPSWFLMLSGFFLFRLFDIAKPLPIRHVEKFPGGWGIMADDIMAAIYAGLLVHIYLLLK